MYNSSINTTQTNGYNSDMTVKKDTIYQNIRGEIKPFEFDEQVAEVFPDMIKRSVPGYGQTIAMMSVIADKYAQDDSQIYDLGCSLGAMTIALGQSIKAKNCRIVAVDNSEAMIQRCNSHLQHSALACSVELQQADICDVLINNASIVVMNFTLQFLPIAKRTIMIQSIYDGLLQGGVLLISEKIHTEDSYKQQMLTQLHHSYKRLNGYDDLEISAKRTALENVLVTESVSEHQQRLTSIGFKQTTVIMQNLNFVTLLAEK